MPVILKCHLICLFLMYVLHTAAASVIIEPTLNMTVTSRNTYYITISWEVEDPNATIEAYRIVAQDFKNNYRATYEGKDNIDITTKTSEVSLHQSDTAYEVCMIAYLTPETSDQLNLEVVEDCKNTSTIQSFQRSSYTALILVGGFFVGCIVLGFLTWKYKKFIMSRHIYGKAETTENGRPPLIKDGVNSNHQTSSIEA